MNERKVSFALSMVVFWVKGHITVTQRDVKCQTANTILGLIPAGKKEQTIPLRNISDASLDTRYNIKSIFLGVIMSIIGIALLKSSAVLGMVFLFLGIVDIMNGIETALTIQRAGKDWTVAVPFYEKGKLLDIKDAIQEALNYEADKTDNNFLMAQNATNSQQIIDAINQLKKD